MDAKLRNAVLVRTVFTSSDLTGADIYGADFTNALVDRSQQLKLCKYVLLKSLYCALLLLNARIGISVYVCFTSIHCAGMLMG